MSDIARLHLALVGMVAVFAAIVFVSWPASAEPVSSALASPYCANRALPELNLLAGAAYAKDITTGEVIYSKNADVQLPLASLTKLMTVLAAMDVLSPDDEITVSRAALAPEGNGLAEGEVWKAGDLVNYTLIASVNDGAHALAIAASEKAGEDPSAFPSRMNEKAKALGLVQTYFTNDTGLDISETAAASYGSASDIAALLEYLAVSKPSLIEATTARERSISPLSGRSHTAKNTSALISTLPGAIASKTGFTDIAGGNLGIVFEPVLGRPVVAVVLGSTREDRDQDMKVLAENAKKWMTRMLLCEDGEPSRP